MAGPILRRCFLEGAVGLLSLVIFAGWSGSLLAAQGKQAPATESQPEEIEQQPAPEEKPEAVVPTPRRPRTTQPRRAPERRMVPAPNVQGEMVSLNFSRADLVEVVHVLAQHLKLNYTIDPEVRGTVTIHSAEPLKKEDLLPVFHQILRMNGAVAVKTGELYRIVPIKDGKGLARPMTQTKEDAYAIQVVPVRFFSVAEMKKLLSPFITPGGEIQEHPRGNFLIIVDLPSNIQRLMEIRDLIDVNTFAGTRMEIYQPKAASAEELATEMAKVMQAYAASATQTEGFAAQFIPIPRINRLLVISHSEAAWTYVNRWLERIDTIGEGPGRRIFIYPVENGKAVELADVLGQALGLAPAVRREPPRTLQELHRGPTPTREPRAPRAPGAPTTQPQTPGSPLYAVVPAPAAVAPPARPTPPTAPPTPEARPAQEQLRIVPDPATNSLIIYGTAQEFQNIKTILKDLDIIPRQVLLEVLVASVTLGPDTNSFGIDYEFRKRGENFTDLFSSSTPIQAGGTIGGITALVRQDRLRALITVLQTDKRAKILASPLLLATDNRPARIQVGSEEPIPTGTVQTPEAGGAIVSSTTIQFRNTGRILTIIPQVNSKGLVNLQVKAEVSDRGPSLAVGGTSKEPQEFPSFTTKDVETTAVVQDGETLVIGGIISESRSRSRSGIPYLMDIPVFGRFFGKTTDELERTELLILITPHVIRNLDEARSVTEEFKEKLSTVAREIERMRKESRQEKKTP